MLPDAGQQALDAFHHFHGVRAGLLLNREDHRFGAIYPELAALRRDAVGHATQVLQPHRVAVAIADDHRRELRGRAQLAVRLNGVRFGHAVEGAGRHVYIPMTQGIADLLQAHFARSQAVRVDLNAHRVLLGAVDLHLRNAADHRNLTRHQSFRILVERGHGHGRRRNAHVENRFRRRVLLVVGRRRRHVGRQFT